MSLDALLALEHQGWDALCTSTGGAFYGDLMTEEGRIILVNGVVLDRDAVVASLDQAPAWDEYELTEPQRVTIGRDAAALIYRAVARRGDDPPFEALMSSTYVLAEGRPRLALYQQTTVTD